MISYLSLLLALVLVPLALVLVLSMFSKLLSSPYVSTKPQKSVQISCERVPGDCWRGRTQEGQGLTRPVVFWFFIVMYLCGWVVVCY